MKKVRIQWSFSCCFCVFSCTIWWHFAWHMWHQAWSISSPHQRPFCWGWKFGDLLFALGSSIPIGYMNGAQAEIGRVVGEAKGHGDDKVTIWRWLSCWNMRNTDFWCEFWRISGLSQKPKTGNRRESYFVDFYAHDQNLILSWSSLKENGVRLADIFAMVFLWFFLWFCLWFIYGFSMVYLWFVRWFSIWFCEVFYGFCILCSRGCNKKSLGHLRWPKFGPAK